MNIIIDMMILCWMLPEVIMVKIIFIIKKKNTHNFYITFNFLIMCN